jgi:hypothetical protein
VRGTTTWWLWVGAMGLAVSPAGAAVSVTFEPSAVVATGISPSQQVVVFGVAREPTAFSVRVVSRVEVLTDEDGDGKVSYAVEAGLVGASVWWVVDLATGEAAVGAPEDFEVRWVPAEDETLPSASAAEPELTVSQRSRLEVLLVRPGVGAWRGSAADGGRADSDASPDGVLRVPLLGLDPVETSAEPLTSLQGGDLLFAIAPNTLEVLSFSPAVAP